MEYFEAITCIEAQKNLVDLNIADFPHLKENARRKTFKDFKKMAYPKGLQKEVSFEDFAKSMGLKNG